MWLPALLLLQHLSADVGAIPLAPPASTTTATTTKAPVDPCANAPAGMACLPAGVAHIGEGGARTVTLERTFIDTQPVTATDYAACVAFKACAPLGKKPKSNDEPVVLDWTRAERYCAFAGKRLPSEAEWEAAAQKGVFHDGATEWTNSWFVSEKRCQKTNPKPGAACGPTDPLEPCDGAFLLCSDLSQKVVKDPTKPTERLSVPLAGEGKKIGVRCATSSTYLTRYPSNWTTVARAKTADPTPPTAEQLATFNHITEDVLDTPTCPAEGRSFIGCRDPRSYVTTNEPRQQVLIPYVENMGGGYTGVASDQNYTFIALARSSWAWLFDYDPNVVRVHRVLRAMILDAPDRASLTDHFRPKAIAHGLELIEHEYSSDPDKAAYLQAYKAYAPTLLKSYEHQRTDPTQAYTWLGSDEHYGYIRLLTQQGRMRAFKGNMLDKNTMQGIGEAARKLGVVIHIYYPSNAAEFWNFTDQYRSNVRNLPFDDQSIVVQTISGIGLKSGFNQRGYWHYNVMYGKHQQDLLQKQGITREKQLLYNRIKTDNDDLTLTGLPSR
jgi:hypothetical protein